MRQGFLDWTTRVVMLVLAGMVTLSILGSIEAMTQDAGQGGGTGTREQPVLAQEAEPRPEQPAPPPATAPDAQAPEPSGSVQSVEVAAAAVPEEEDETARWLEAIAYALLALAGLAAIGLVLLWQAVRQLRRAADAAETASSRGVGN